MRGANGASTRRPTGEEEVRKEAKPEEPERNEMNTEVIKSIRVELMTELKKSEMAIRKVVEDSNSNLVETVVGFGEGVMKRVEESRSEIRIADEKWQEYREQVRQKDEYRRKQDEYVGKIESMMFKGVERWIQDIQIEIMKGANKMKENGFDLDETIERMEGHRRDIQAHFNFMAQGGPMEINKINEIMKNAQMDMWRVVESGRRISELTNTTAVKMLGQGKEEGITWQLQTRLRQLDQSGNLWTAMNTGGSVVVPVTPEMKTEIYELERMVNENLQTAQRDYNYWSGMIQWQKNLIHQVENNVLQLTQTENGGTRPNATRGEGGHRQMIGRSAGAGGVQGERKNKRRKKENDGAPAVIRTQEGPA